MATVIQIKADYVLDQGDHSEDEMKQKYSRVNGGVAVGENFPGGSVVKTPCSQCRGPGFDPCSGNWIPHATTKSSHATAKDTTCGN